MTNNFCLNKRRNTLNTIYTNTIYVSGMSSHKIYSRRTIFCQWKAGLQIIRQQFEWQRNVSTVQLYCLIADMVQKMFIRFRFIQFFDCFRLRFTFIEHISNWWTESSSPVFWFDNDSRWPTAPKNGWKWNRNGCRGDSALLNV